MDPPYIGGLKWVGVDLFFLEMGQKKPFSEMGQRRTFFIRNGPVKNLSLSRDGLF